MGKLPEYVGPCALGIKMGVITPGCDLIGLIYDAMERCDGSGFLDNADVICITESVVARAQDNFVTTREIASELGEKHNIRPDNRLGVLFPITSRNRFAVVLRGLARAVPQGEVIVQFSFPRDEVGNVIVSLDFAEKQTHQTSLVLAYEDIKNCCLHPITKIDYPGYYKEIIETEGARAKIYFSNNPEEMISVNPDCVIIANIHERQKTRGLLQGRVPCCLTLQDICNDRSRPAWSEWGLLGSNMSSDDLLNLAPRDGDGFAAAVQEMVYTRLGKAVEVVIYGDGAYKDPATGIYELADPQPCLGSTAAFKEGIIRQGFKYKLLADSAYIEGKSREEIEEILAAHRQKQYGQHEMISEGTTPRKMEDLIASLADLVSGSADAGTPLVLVKGLLKKR